MKYKIGDKVRVRDDIEAFKEYKMDGSKNLAWATPGMLKFRGETLTITKIDRYGMYSVNEDNGDWCWVDEMFSGLVTDRLKVIITTDGKTTTAKMYEGKKLLKTAESSCSPEDTFDFAVGAKIAFNRLMKNVEMNIKVICINDVPRSNFTKGKIYTVKNGFLYGNSECFGADFFNKEPFESIKQINDRMGPQFVEVLS